MSNRITNALISNNVKVGLNKVILLKQGIIICLPAL